MSGLSDYSAKGLLNWVSGSLAMAAAPSVYLGLFTAVGTDANSGFTEVSGGSYARVQVAGTATTNNTTAAANATLHFASTPAWITAGMQILDSTTAAAIASAQTVSSTTGTTVVMSAGADGSGVGNGDVIRFSSFTAASGSAPSQITNASATITFAQATANWGTVIAFGLFDASSSGNLLAWDYMGAYSWLPCTVSSASPGIITAKAHGYSNGDSFVFSTEYGGTAPSFSSGNFTGLLTVAGAATDSFNNASSNTSSTGSGMVRKVIQQSIPINATASFSTSQLTVTSA